MIFSDSYFMLEIILDNIVVFIIEVNFAYRWYLGYGLSEEVPHFSTFGKNYPRRFDGTGLFETIFARIDRGWENASDAVWQAKDDKRIFPKK